MRVFNKIRFLLWSSLCLLPILLGAQAPGGVSTGLQVWLKADDPAFTVGGSGLTSNWPDASGRGNHGTYFGSGGGYSVVADKINFNPTVQLDDEHFEVPVDLNATFVHVFTVHRLDQNNDLPIWGNGLGANDGKQVLTKTYTNGSSRVFHTTTNVRNNAYVHHIAYANAGGGRNTLSGRLLEVTTTNPTNSSKDSFYLGGSNSNNLYSFIFNSLNGNNALHVAECIVYTSSTQSLSANDIQQVQSYLAIKYGITLPTDYQFSTGVSPWTRSNHVGYEHRIFGIAEDAGSGLGQPHSKSEENNSYLTLAIHTPADLTDGKALMVGDNNQPTNAVSTNTAQYKELFLGEAQHIQRTWSVQNTGNLATTDGFTLTFDGTMPTPTSFSNEGLVLLVADDNSFTQTVHAYPLMWDGSDWTAQNVVLNDGEFFTIARPMASLWAKADASDNIISSNRVDQLTNQLYDANNLVGVDISGGASHPNYLNNMGGTDDMNFYPYVRFNQNSEENYLHISDYQGFGGYSGSIFMVMRRDNSGGNVNNEALFSYSDRSGSNQGNEWLITDPTNLSTVVQHGNRQNNYNRNIANNRPALITCMANLNIDTVGMGYNGVSSSQNNRGRNNPFATGGSLTLGQEQNNNNGGFGNNRAWEGDFAEIIVLNRSATPQEQRHIETYLALKYGITLAGNYEAMDGLQRPQVVWDTSHAGGRYHHRVTGVGRWDAFGWQQVQARNQSENGANLTIMGATTSADAVLIVGDDDGDYNRVTALNPFGNLYLSNRIWYVRNSNNNGVDTVDLKFTLPRGFLPTSRSVQLFIDTSTSFQSNSIIGNYVGTVSNGEVVFRNVVLQDGQYFCVGEERDLSFVNQSTAWPGSFEACPGDSVAFYYQGLAAHPNEITFDSAGSKVTMSVNTFPYSATAGLPANAGYVVLTIPPNAKTGILTLSRNTGTGRQTLYTFPGNFIVHNPNFTIYTQTSPICASDSVQLEAIPSGGYFIGQSSALPLAADPMAIDSMGLVDGTAVGWSTLNDSVRVLTVRYDYLPQYSNGGGCDQVISTLNTLTIRDNRLSRLRYRPVRRPTTSINSYGLNLDTTVITQIVPNLLDPSFQRYGFPVYFSGTYVNTFTNGQYRFLETQALGGRSSTEAAITMSYNNGGCIGSLEEDVVVFEPASIIDLPDTLCVDASAVVFTRDTSLVSRYFRDTSYFASGPHRYTYYRQNNRVTDVLTVDSNFRSAIQVVDTTTLNGERFSFDPQGLPSDTSIIVEMRYSTLTTVVDSNFAYNPVRVTVSYRSYFSSAFDTVLLLPRPVLSMQGLDPSYCTEDEADTLQVFPAYEYASRTYFTVTLTDTFAPTTSYTIVDSLDEPLLVDPEVLYLRHRPNAVYDLKYYVTYHVNRYGCLDEIGDTTLIRRPKQPEFYHDTTYCLSNNTIQLNANVAVLGRPGQFTPQLGLDATGDMNTSLLGPGYHGLEYTHVDNLGCQTSFRDTIYVRTPPDVELYVGGSRTATTFCTSASPVGLTYQLLSGSGVASAQYTGIAVQGTTLDPSQAPNGGTFNLVLTVVDSFQCRGEDNLLITIQRAPPVDLNVAFNGNSRILSSGFLVNHSYCLNYPTFSVLAHPHHIDASNNRRGVFSGQGIYTQGDSVYYDPSLVPEGTVDTILYEYTTANGCVNTGSTYLYIDTIPSVSLVGLQANYCARQDTISLSGNPAPANARPNSRNTGFGGPGMNINTGALDFTRAGVGQVIYSYSFEDNNFCVGIDYDTAYIYPSPSASFSGYNARKQYCRYDNSTQWQGDNRPSGGAYDYFWMDSGAVFIDSSGLFTPDPSNGMAPNSAIVGSHTINYTYVDTNGCAGTQSINIFVHPIPIITLTGLDVAYCQNAPQVQIPMSEQASTGSNTSSNFTTSGNILTFDPSASGPGQKRYTLDYTHPTTGCSDQLQGVVWVAFPPSPQPSFNIDTSYCEMDPTVDLTALASPRGGGFTGAGVDSTSAGYFFKPIQATSGAHTIRYTIQRVSGNGAGGNITCKSLIEKTVFVRPNPIAGATRPADGLDFCSTDTAVHLVPPNIFTDSLYQFLGNGITRFDTSIYVQIAPNVFQREDSSSFHFDPSVASNGSNTFFYTVTNTYGCADTVPLTYDVTTYPSGSLFQLDTIFCASDDSTLLFSAIGSNGLFQRNGIPIVSSPPYYVPNARSFTTPYAYDTVVYDASFGACDITDTTFVTLSRSVFSDFHTVDSSTTFCLGTDPIELIPEVPGGRFSGDGIRSDSTVFDPTIVNAGTQTIIYTIIDALTQCVSETERTFRVYGQPSLSYHIVGGCQGETVKFIPDSMITGVNSFELGRLIDSVTSVQWVLSPDTIVQGVLLDSVKVDTVTFVYAQSGRYETKLIVNNRSACVDTHTVSLVVSPMVTTFPYVEDFENDEGGYYAEGRTPTHDVLWEWGIDSTASIVTGGRNNHIWSTGLNRDYDILEDAWVYPPCFDIDLLSRPMIKLDYWSDTRNSADGVVIEFQLDDGTWKALGELERGINWYDADLIGGTPGDQTFAPMGWSGVQNKWLDGRYKLDDLQNQVDKLRLRIAFGSSSVPMNGAYYNGFSFDNFTVQNRTRNVLLETTSHHKYSRMERANNNIYGLVFGTPLIKDVVLAQYHTNIPDTRDEFYGVVNPSVISRMGDLGDNTARLAYTNGLSGGNSLDVNAEQFEQAMLESPKFEIIIDTFLHLNSEFIVVAKVKALEPMPFGEYRIQVLIVEDSLEYRSDVQADLYGGQMHAVVRQGSPRSFPFTERHSWRAGETKTVRYSWDYSRSSGINYEPNRFQTVAFIYNPEDSEVLQAATTRDASGYLIGVNPIQAQAQYNEISTMTLFPNPAQNEFNVRFDQPLSTDYQWKLMDLRGIEVQTGTAEAGTELMTIERQDYPAGTYLLLLYNDQVFAQRKVILYR